MPPRGNEALDFTPILTHYLFLFTSILSVVRSPIKALNISLTFFQLGWFIAFISQIIATARCTRLTRHLLLRLTPS